jgi:hypothetical protein
MHPHNDVKYLSQIRIFFIVCTTVTVYGEDPRFVDTGIYCATSYTR